MRAMPLQRALLIAVLAACTLLPGVVPAQATPARQIDSPMSAQDFYRRGVDRAQTGDNQGAIEDFSRALQLASNYGGAYHDRGIVRARVGDLPGAIDDLTQALRINPNNAEAYLDRAFSRSRQGDNQGAIDDYTEALRINPSDSTGYYNRGVVRRRLGDTQAAIDDYTEALRINPDYAPAYSSRAEARSVFGDSRGAAEDYTQAVRLNPNDASAYNSRARARRQLGDMQGATEDYRRAAELYLAQGDAGRQQTALNAIRAIERSAAAPPPSAATVPGRVLYQDDFTDASSGWPRQAADPEGASRGYENGEYYLIRVRDRPGWLYLSRTREGFTDFQVEIDARVASATEGAYVFLGFRRQPNGDHYALIVDPDDGTYRLLRHSVGSPSATIIGRTRSTAIQPGAATNRLGVRAQGADLIMLINGLEVGRARDEQWRQGSLVLGVGQRGETTSTEGRFANLVLSSLD
jgi:tetratricopeptide (TPR) repeat protein